MAKEITIHCEDCGHPEQTKAKNAKRCHVCRILRNCLFVRGRRRECYLCEASYIPIAREDVLCANCAFRPSSSEDVECKYCGKTRLSVAKTIRVCMWCARDPQYRKDFEKSLQRKAKHRREHPPEVVA